MRFIFSILAMTVLAAPAWAADTVSDSDYFTLKSVKISEIPENMSLDMEQFLGPSDSSGWGGVIGKVAPTVIVNIGTKVWELIQENQPVIQFETQMANALPSGAKNWRQLDGWQTPRSRLFRVQYTNAYGMDVVDFTFRVLYTYGGSVAGRGRYLTNVTMLPADLEVSWGYKLNAQASVQDVTNAGTRKDPIAGMQLTMNWSVDTIIRKSRGSSIFYIRGDGQFVDLSSGN